jgi:branched-chain amino acid transport system substrate-binding protein
MRQAGLRCRFLLSVLVALGLVASACQPGGGATSQPPPTSGTPTKPATADTAPKPPASKGTLKLGMLLAMTGSGSFYGQVMSRGAQVAVDQINREGGASGYPLQLVIEDHRSGDADAGVSGARKLMDIDGVPMILTSFSAPTLAIQPLAAEKKVLLLNGGGVGAALVGKKGLYNTRMLSTQLVPFVVEWATQDMAARRIATAFWNDAAGQGINTAINDACGRLACQVVAQEPHDLGAKTYSAQLARIKAARPDVLILGSFGDDVGYIVNQARAQGLDNPILGVEWTPNAQKVGGQAMEGYIAVIDRFEPGGGDQATRAFVEAYRTAYGETPEFYAANYYELVQFVLRPLIQRAVERGDDPTQPGPLLQEMEKAVAEGSMFQSVYGGEMQFAADGTVTKPAGLYRVQGDELALVARIVGGTIQR